MTQYNSLNVKLSNSHLNELKSSIKNETKVVLRLSSNMIGDDKTNFPHKLLLTDRAKFLCNNKHVTKRTYDAISFSFFIFIYHIIIN